ncbi:tetratricopeptide repeat protein [Tenacibaculum finnmarkense]|uniref:tetratricopeptide repeat protein n=1 Tax=Tenacibaculum finnmarkense TaxID=2781243 RepID=UPI00187B6EF1|nr:tetratricopeptide repeat protein [Tenacibaculum finnmarkense]MBE7660288.1 tetratricopeptide repeat protein [Tenacibaculum finnmarkense genomovar finnmarkense]MCG8251976.1 tetratricopeptide repeat protein [Tenacibaculum finnmarkense genomovar finnmarkense]MCG8815505.1 tetratricopeptide repeat protein [Tenacibaculum finnmarkense]MCG8820529.1 tetratricopeptide repeat protein [Tenacibaculum finnmarkense]MCG8893041.1 tetratricopeptide repeat protein [Tenacibaculum finnmarkense]
MKIKHLTFLLFFITSTSIFSQNMKEGFTYLETGKYQQAEAFFENILKSYPTNKTARLCYGRALGLNGNSYKAVTLFTNLLNDFPSDFEVKLNYAESLLWNKDYNKAEEYYKNLISENDKSFPALLGYANTLSNLKKFNKAINYVNKALIVLPNNQNALVSKKYMRLGLANSKVNTKNYTAAEKILKENFIDFKKDKETLLNLANLYLISNQIDKAKEIYIIIGEDSTNKLTSLNGISLANHLDGDDKEALIISKKAVSILNNTTDKSIKNQTKERFIQALIWNNKYSLAEKEINKLLVNNKDPENWILSLRATLNIYKSDFKKSIADYNLILKKDSASFDGNLGKANALKASGYFIDAYKSAENTLSFYKKQKDATNFIKNLDKSFTPFVEVKTAYSFDNADNKAYLYAANLEFPFSTKLKLFGNYSYRTTSNSVTKASGISNNFSAGIAYQLLNNATFKGVLGISASDTDTNKFSQLLADLSLKIKPFKLQDLEIGYKREVQNFNADLLDKEIIQNNFLINYSLNTNFNLGWYTQLYYTSQSDENTRNLLFTSLYYNIFKKPSLKAGVNYQNISFKNQVPTIYFSPRTFSAAEIFINIIKDENIAKNKEWFYELTAATGFQFIEKNKKQSTYRIQAKLGYKFSERSLLNIYGTQSNIASASAISSSADFTFTEIGLRFKWCLKNVFFKK